MTTLTLKYQGPASQARAALADLLQRFRSAYFVEHSNTEYLVTADGKTALALKQLPEWSHHRHVAGKPGQKPGKS